MTSSIESSISLIDLNKQFPFAIDDDLKSELCFGETLVISCGHYEGNIEHKDEVEVDEEEESVSSEWTCTDTGKTVTEEKVEKPFEIHDYVEPEAEPEEEFEADDDFHLFFFPDCNKPMKPQGSKDSLLIGPDGFPKTNPRLHVQERCTCKKSECSCFVKLPCLCGATEQAKCVCGQLEKICICDDPRTPNIVCTCTDAKVCTCRSTFAPSTKCHCDDVQKPCVCYPDKAPYPVCVCKSKPKFGFLKELDTISSVASAQENEMEEYAEYSEEQKQKNEGKHTKNFKEEDNLKQAGEQEPCTCQEEESEPSCLCARGKECTCEKHTCICGAQKTCTCESEEGEPVCKSADSKSKSICSCNAPCTCEKDGIECKCFPNQMVCTCENPAECACTKVCDCGYPCICDTAGKMQNECICLDKDKQITRGLVCTCLAKGEQSTKLKKVRAGKHGYRWCHDVDPKHTFFDYGYDRHDKILTKEQDQEVFKILGIYGDKYDDVCPIHGIKKPPKYKKKVRKPSIDCCSTVGGISISVESLGEGKGKYLVQVVSHASKEGAKTGSKLVSILDSNLHTLEENRVETITRQEETKERRCYMAISDTGYYNKVSCICGGREIVKRNYHSFSVAHDFMLEGANIILLRYFALRRYKGLVKTDTVLMNGVICESIYVCPGVSQGVVNGKPMFIVKVERHIIEPSGHIHQSLTVLSQRGYVISHEWADNNYTLHLNPLLNVIPEKDRIEPHAPLRENWRNDLQLLSDFLEYKSTRTSESARYIAENGMLSNTIRDYLQTVLLLRPQDVVHFTRHYFHSCLSAIDLPHNEYFDDCPKQARYYYFDEQQ